jgi:hypothetical protein
MAEALGKVFDERTTRRIDHFGKDAVPMGQGVVQLIEPLAGFGPLTKFGTGVVRCDVLPKNHAIGKLARQMETSDAARPFYRGSDHRRAARA